jgi:hypothetical protein
MPWQICKRHSSIYHSWLFDNILWISQDLGVAISLISILALDMKQLQGHSCQPINGKFLTRMMDFLIYLFRRCISLLQLVC